MTYEELYHKYYSTRSNCCKCGCELQDVSGIGLGAIFVLDKDGNFYCMGCDSEFEDGDERIFEFEEE